MGPVAEEAPRDAAYLVYAGTASEWQGAEIFAEAMRVVVQEDPRARLVFLGQGSAWPALQRIAAELPAGAIELRPLVPPAQAAAWQRGAAGAVVSVRPGLDYDFAYPTKVIAALACGTPVVYAGPGPAADDLTAARPGPGCALRRAARRRGDGGGAAGAAHVCRRAPQGVLGAGAPVRGRDRPGGRRRRAQGRCDAALSARAAVAERVVPAYGEKTP